MESWLLIRVAFIVFLLPCTIVVGAQTKGSVFYHLTTKNGLSCSRSNAVLQDSKGFYWITTDDGLNRFDGSSCKIFRNIKNDSTSLTVNYCNPILEDDLGDIWVGTSMGINRYIYAQDKFERFFLDHPAVSFDRVNMISGLQKDDEGNIWIASHGLWQYNIYSRKRKAFLHDPANSTTIPEGIATHLNYDKKNKGLWMNVRDSYVFFHIKTGKFYHNNNNPYNNALLKISGSAPIVLDSNNRIWFCNSQLQLSSYSISDNNIHITPYQISKGFFKLSTDAEHRIWVHYWFGGTIIYNPKTQKADSNFLAASHPKSALHNQAKNLYIDKNSIYWIMSSKGVSIYNPNNQAVQYFLLQGNRKTAEGVDNSIYCVLEQDENNLWLGTNTGICSYNISKNKFRYFDHLPFSGTIIKCLFLQDKTKLWVGTQNALFIYDIMSDKILKKFPFKIHTQFITSDKEENIWVGTWHNGLYSFSARGEFIKYFTKAQESLKTILHDNLIGFKSDAAKSYMWIGYNGGYGFCKLDFNENIFRHYKIKTGERHFNSINTINCFSEDSNGNLWIGGNGGGIFYFKRSDNIFKNFTQSDGLKSNYINAILPDETGKLWIATSNGVSILNTFTHEIINTALDVEMGSNGFLPSALLRKNKKMIFFSGSKLIEVDPTLFQQNAYPSQILFSSFKIFDKEHSLAEKQSAYSTSLSYNQNFFSIEYSLFNPNPNSSNQYAYQLKGFDEKWVNASERRIANYTNIPPGKYTFYVKATDVSGKNYFSKPIVISISPPFWKTWWFFTMSTVALVAALYFIYYYRLAQVKKVYLMRSKISQDLHDEIGATLSSIHVYSSVAAKAIDKSPDKSLDALQHINNNTRQVMENMSDIVWAINARSNNETTFEGKLKNYGYELLTPLNIQCIYTIDKEIEKKLINIEARKNVLLIAKEAMNNIAKHSKANEASVTLALADKYLFLEIKDNGNGFNQNYNYSGNGLGNMKNRTEAIKGIFKISSEKNIGTVIRCNIPLAKISD